MSKNTYFATMNYYDSSWGWGNEGTASQGKWDGTGTRTGVLYFAGLSALKGKIINSVSLTVNTGQTGWGTDTTKTAYIYNSASQGGIKTSLNANHKTGNALGNVKAPMWGNTKTFTVSFLASPIASGYDTYCIYAGSSTTDYLKWTSVSLVVDWSEPATKPILSASSANMGSAVTITTTASNSAYKHNIWAQFGNASIAIAEKVSTGATWTPSLDLAKQIPNSTSGTGTIYCDTFAADGVTQLGTKTVSITLNVPSSVKPSAGTLSAAINSDTSGTGKYVVGMCKAKLTLSGATGSYGSTIKSYRIAGGGFSADASTLTTGALTTSGTITFTGTVTDSRGRTSNSVTCSISVLNYTKPSISSCSVYRCDESGAKANAGTYFAVKCTAKYSSGISGNTLAISARYKKSSESSYSAATACTNGATKVIGGSLSTSSTYDVQVIVKDSYNTVTFSYQLPTRSTVLSFIKNTGAAIGKVAELKNWLDIAWSTRIRGNLQVDGDIISPDMSKIKWTAIPNNANLNSSAYKVPGFYRSQTGSNTITNTPDTLGSGAFELIVTGISDNSYCTQRLKAYNSDREWVRTQTTWQEPWTWTGWKEIVTYTDASGRGLALNSVAKADVQAGISFYRACSSNNSNVKRTFVFEGSGDLPELSLWQSTPGGSTATVLNCGYNAGYGYLYPGNTEVDIGKTSDYFRNGYFTNVYASSLKWKTLYSGTLKSGTATLTDGAKYAALIIYGKPSSTSDYVDTTIPPGDIGKCQLTDNTNFLTFTPKQSGNNITITINSAPSSGYITRIWGIVKATA